MKIDHSSIRNIIRMVLLIIVVGSVGYLAAKEYVGSRTSHEEKTLLAEAPKTLNGMVVYYFHGNRRCPTCMAIEEYSHEAAVPLLDMDLVSWRTVNVDDRANEHYLYDFQLKSSGPVIVEYKAGKVARWKALDRVWTLVRDKQAFMAYVSKELSEFLKAQDKE